MNKKAARVKPKIKPAATKAKPNIVKKAVTKPKTPAKPQPAAAKKEKAPMKKQPAAATAQKSGTTARQLSKSQLEHFRKKLIAERERVLGEVGDLHKDNIKQSIADQSGENSRYSYHLGDVASLSYEREFTMGLAERQQKYLEQIDDALRRIDGGTYGICLATGEAIPVERLEEVPVAKYSVRGKEIMEHRKRQLVEVEEPASGD